MKHVAQITLKVNQSDFNKYNSIQYITGISKKHKQPSVQYQD